MDAMDTLSYEHGRDDSILTTREAAHYLRVRPQALRSWASEGREDRPQPCGGNGRSNLYRLGDLRRFRESARRMASPHIPHNRCRPR